MKVSLLIFIFAFGLYTAYAQEVSTFGTEPAPENKSVSQQPFKRAVVKFNLVKALFKAPYVQGEFALNNRMSVSLAVTGWKKSLSQKMVDNFAGNNDTAALIFSSLRLNYLAVCPEFRYYLSEGEEKEGPNGFYISPYLRWSRYKLTFPFKYIDPKYGSYDFTGKITSVGAGFYIGYQIIGNSGFTFDIWFIGGRLSAAKMTLAVDGNFTGTTAADKAKTETDVNNLLGKIPFLKNGIPDYNFGSSRIEAKSGFPTLGGRCLGFNLGWAF